MAHESSWFQGTRASMTANISPYAKRAMASPLIRAGVEDIGFAFGVGPKGVFSSSTLDPFYEARAARTAPRLGKEVSMAAARRGGLVKAMRKGGRSGWKGFLGKAGGRALGPIATAAFGGMHYQQLRSEGAGQISAAAQAIGTQVGAMFVFGVGMKAIGMIGGGAMAIAPVAAAAAIGYGTYKILEHGNAVVKRTRQLEMGKPIVDPYGMNATMRQRSLRAMQFSQINGRSAFGTEAQLMHIPTMRG